MTRNIGIPVSSVTPKPGDKKDPFTQPLSVYGQQLTGTVISVKAQRTATILIQRQVIIPKYQRYVKRKSKILVHNPDSIQAQEGDVVRVIATRPLSKTKHHVIVEIIKKAGDQGDAQSGSVAVDVQQYKEAHGAQHKSTKSEGSDVSESTTKQEQAE